MLVSAIYLILQTVFINQQEEWILVALISNPK